jgi:hypothetical protein
MTDIDQIGNIPTHWANGDPITTEDRFAIALLRLTGCACELPLLRTARDDHWLLAHGPRCKSCDRQMLLVPPTVEETLAYRRVSHQVMVNYGLHNPGVFDELDWKIECFTGCGCDGSGNTLKNR